MNSTTALVALAAVAVVGGIGYMLVQSKKASATGGSNAEQINAAVAAYERGAKRSPAEKIFSGAADLLGFG